MTAPERLNTIKRHLTSSPFIDTVPKYRNNVSKKNTIPCKRQQLLKWNGWGYKESSVILNKETGKLFFTGKRYPLGNKVLPHLRSWLEKSLHADMDNFCATQPEISDSDLPPGVINNDFMQDLVSSCLSYSLEGEDRLFRAHGHTLQEIHTLRSGRFARIPDVVVWPECQKDIVDLVQMASHHNVVIIPYGGGTNVTMALECSPKEDRMIVSLDTSQMNKILWVDKVNMLAHIEAGIIGQDLENELSKQGVCLGHEPDSYEFSSLGGWVATRASGMKRNIYGNIEDMVVHITMVTPTGVVTKCCQAPRVSTGPDIHHFILGSEGTLGVITEVTLRIRPLPEHSKYGSIAFPTFEAGVSFMKEVAQRRLKPASLRLVDNEQFIFGQCLKHENHSLIKGVTDELKKLYLQYFKRFNLQKLSAATILLEGNKKEVQSLELELNKIAHKYGGIPGGEENGKLGYALTFVIAYLRDSGLDYGLFGESLETSVPWDRVLDTCTNTKVAVERAAYNIGLQHPSLVSCRVTQCYETGACIYFYIGLNGNGLEDPVGTYHILEEAARKEIIDCGGSLSHHHGVGKIRKHWMKKSLSEPGIKILKALKEHIDPQNIFACGNII